MKKLISTTLVLTMILSMCACGAKKENASNETANSEAVSTEEASAEEAVSSEATEAATEAVSGEATEAAAEDASSESENADTSTAENPHQPKVIGELAYINADEELVKKYEVVRMLGLYAKEEMGDISVVGEHDHKKLSDMTKEDLKELYENVDVKMFDSLTSMTMALQAGDIDNMTLYDSVANYICAKNSDLEVEETYKYDYDEITYEDDSILKLTKGFTSDEFTFKMLEGNEALRDEFNSAIADMKNDGTLTRLTKEFITEVDFSADAPSSPDFESFDGADTIKVGVTGDLPPFDYMTESGTPEGFNKAILTEIGKRIGKNIELVSIDAGSRALALSSGQIDVVFWTRSQELDGKTASDDAEAPLKAQTHEERVEKLTEQGDTPEDAKIIATLLELIPEFLKDVNPRELDSPDGTINTEFFYAAPIVHVRKKK